MLSTPRADATMGGVDQPCWGSPSADGATVTTPLRAGQPPGSLLAQTGLTACIS
eukprot:SAG22_NODE_20770_length_263_cov_0.530488_1_plen_53_part_01